jgi:hypothetical protein
MQRPPLDVYVSPEASDDERSAVAESFDGFEVSLIKGEYRFSDAAASLVINIFLAVVSAAVYDLLKAGINKLRSQPKSRIGRKTEVKIRVTQKEYIITPDVFVARENTKERYFSSVEELLDDLKPK